jgi:hypothetical protein
LVTIISRVFFVANSHHLGSKRFEIPLIFGMKMKKNSSFRNHKIEWLRKIP